ncbi:DUF5316 family protein [Paenibacillus tepidiphilus]|uniref:DUF5316 family protein n=1 Tax=Paenibacillus tepidiphilus TaxID=2608683 RepID=UPI0013A55FD3
MRLFYKSLFYGFSFAFIIFIISWFDPKLAITISGFLGGGLLILAMIFSGSLNSGDRLRANYSRESNEERNVRFEVTGTFLKLGVPSLALCILLYFL